jgi:hypothetical protein
MYSTNEEYRQFLRVICGMELGKMYCDAEYDAKNMAEDEVDPETLDEFEYDNSAMSEFLDHIYAATRQNELFRELYSSAAALMFSENEEIGLAVLCSYDYLLYFYSCFITYMEATKPFDRTTPEYARILDAVKYSPRKR